MKSFILIFLLSALTNFSFAQDPPAGFEKALYADNADEMAKLLTKENINACDGNYSLLSYTAKYGALNCTKLLIEKGADVNKICEGYVPPLMHAVKYGYLEIVKLLVAKGAKVNYTYNGENPHVKGMTPLTYAKKYHQTAIVNYLESLK